MTVTNFKSEQFWAYLQMMRPANILTAWADILVGYAASGAVVALSFPSAETWAEQLIGGLNFSHGVAIAWLLLATTGLYGGGVVFNDLFDAEIDAVERPERPLPSGRASRRGAIGLGVALLVLAGVAAAQVSWVSAGLAGFVAIAALLYDAFSKHNAVLGPVNMGLCRGANLLLGVSVISAEVMDRWFLALGSIAYIAAITAISQGEVHGGKRQTGILSLVMLAAVLGGALGLGFLPNYHLGSELPFMALFAGLVIPTFLRATVDPQPDLIRAAVKSGILSLIVLDAAIAAGFTHWLYGLLVLSLLPISRKLAQIFAVT
jgi:4-hydroxybenzoate polyprenyltransferase